MEEKYEKLNKRQLDLMNKDSKKTVEILKLESKCSTLSEELENIRNQSFNLNRTQVANTSLQNDSQSVFNMNSDLISNYEIKISDLNSQIEIQTKENQMMQQSIQGQSDSISDLQTQLTKKSSDYMEVQHNNSILMEKEMNYKEEIQDLKSKNEELTDLNHKLKSDIDIKQKKIEDCNQELIKLKDEHKADTQKYINMLKENDKLVQNRILTFDKDMLDLQSKLAEIKEGLSKTMESQLEQEKAKMKMTTEDYKKSKESMNENINRLNLMLEKSQKSQDDVKINLKQSLHAREKEIEEQKSIIEEQKCNIQETENTYRNKLAVIEKDLIVLRTSVTDKDREMNEQRNQSESEHSMLNYHFEKVLNEKDHEMSNQISINTDLRGQLEQSKYEIQKLNHERESEQVKNRNLQNQLNLTCSQYNSKIQELNNRINNNFSVSTNVTNMQNLNNDSQFTFNETISTFPTNNLKTPFKIVPQTKQNTEFQNTEFQTNQNQNAFPSNSFNGKFNAFNTGRK